jgi:hypothetical protein
MKEALGSSETSILTRRDIPEDTIPHSHRRENLKSYDLLSFVPGATMATDILLMGRGRFWHMPSSLVAVVEVMPISMKMKRGCFWRATIITVMLCCWCL